jgi:hypothetical protein
MNLSRVAAYDHVFRAVPQSLPANSWIVSQISLRLLPSTFFPITLQIILPVDDIPGVTGQTSLECPTLGGTLDDSRVQRSVATLFIAASVV